MFFLVEIKVKLIGLVYEQNDLLFGANTFSVHIKPAYMSQVFEHPSPSS